MEQTRTSTDEATKSRKEITVTIKTPAGHKAQFTINSNWTIDKVIKDAVEYFVKHNQLQPGNYNLLLDNADSTTTELVGSSQVKDYKIADEATLELVVAGPQVDG